MKIIILILTLLISIYSFGGDIRFKDQVRSITSVKNGVEVTFHAHAAIYSVKNSELNYKGIISKLNSAKTSQSKVNLLVDPIKLEIKEVQN